MAVALEDLDHVGQVVLSLRVVVADFADVGGEQRTVEGVAAGIAFQQLGILLGRAILLFDDAVDRAVCGELDAAVAEGRRRSEGEHRTGVCAVGDRVGEGADGVGLDERQVAVEDHDGSGIDAGGLQRAADGVTGAEALGLLDALDDTGGRRALIGTGDHGADLIGVATHNNDDAVAARRERGVDDPTGHGLSQNLVRHFGMV